MAQQIKVNSSTGNIQISVSRGAIGPTTTANIANTANNLNAATTANVVIGGGVNGYVLSTDGAGVTSWVAQTGGGGSAPGGANTQIQYNDAGTLEGDATFSFNNTTDVVSASHFSGEAGNLSNIQGANVSGAVANASHAVISDSANLVAVANVTGIGNIATVNLDGNAANFLDGTGSFGPAGAGSQTLAQVLTTGNLSSGTGITMSTTDKISFNDAQVNVHSSTDGTLNADADVEIQLQAPYIDLAAANVNMDGNLVITGMYTGDGGGISNIAAANIVGLSVAKIANGTSNVDIATADGDVTVGVGGTADVLTVKTTGANVKTSLFVDGTSGNVLVQPNVAVNGKTYSSVVRGEYNTGTGNSTTSQAIVTDNYTTQGVTEIQSFANTAAGAIAKGPSFAFNNYAAIGNTSTDPLVAGQIDFFAYPDAANLAKADTQTGTTMTMGGPNTDGFLITQGQNAGDTYNSEVWKQFQYRPKSMGFIRRGGNADSRSSPVADDETSLNFYTTQTLSGVAGSLYNWPAKIGSKVDPTWTDPNLGSKGTPEGLFFTVVTEDFANLEHRMYANGDTIFNTSGGGTPITLGYNGVITGDGGGLSNISTSAGTSIVNGTSNVAVALNSDITAGVGGVADVLKLTTTGANIKTSLFVDNTDGNVLVDPNVAFQSNTFTNLTRGKWDGSKSTLNTALVTDDYAGTGQFSQIMYANTTAGQTAQGPKVTFDDKSAIGNTNTDPFVQGAITLSAAASTSNRAATSTLTHTSLELDGDLCLKTGSNLQTGASEFNTSSTSLYQYQNRSLEVFRQNGDGDAPLGVQAGDEAAIHFYMSSNGAGNVGSSFQSYSSGIAGKVDAGFVGNPNAIVPTGVQVQVTSADFDRYNHTFFGNGDVTFNNSAMAYNPNPKNPIAFSDGLITANAFTATTGLFTGDGGGLSNVSATATPGGFNDTIQFNNGGSLDGNSSFQFIPGSNPSVILEGTASSSDVGKLQLQNSILDIYTEDMSGGFTPMSFSTYNSAGFIDPINYYRARGTRSAPTAVTAGDIVKSERNQAYSAAGYTLAYAGGETSTVQANDGLGNLAITTTISTARPANGPNSLDKIDLDTEFVSVHGNLQMDNTSASFVAGRIRQIADTFSNLPASPVTGERAVITDGPAYNTFGTVVSAGGGSNVMPVFWTGSDWRMG